MLAGGKGERLFPFSSLIPKCLVPVAGKPCVRWIIEDILQQGFNNIVLCINNKDEQNFRYEFRDLDIQYSVSSDSRSTVDELIFARDLIVGTFFLRYGDDLTEVSYGEILKAHKEKKATATLAYTTELQLPVGLIKLGENGIVQDFIEKPKLNSPSWIGVAVLEARVKDYFAPGEDIAGNTIRKMLNNHEKVYSAATENNWYDVGNIEHWRKADDYFRKKFGLYSFSNGSSSK